MSNNEPKILLEKAIFHLIETIRSYEDDLVTEEEARGFAADLINTLSFTLKDANGIVSELNASNLLANEEPLSVLGRCLKKYRDKQS